MTGKNPGEHYDKTYNGNLRIVVPAQRSRLESNEDFNLKVIIPGSQNPVHASLKWKKLGSEDPYKEAPLINSGRSVYYVNIPSGELTGEDFEYYISVVDPKSTVVYPSSGGSINQTVIITGKKSSLNEY